MPKKPNTVGLFVQLPKRTVDEIKRRAKASGVRGQWRVVEDAIWGEPLKPKSPWKRP